MGRSDMTVEVSANEREQFFAISCYRCLPHSLVRRAKIVFTTADSHSNTQSAAQRAVTPPAVTHWKKRFVAKGLAGVRDGAKPGRPRTHGDEAVVQLSNKVLREALPGPTHWNVRSAAQHISKSSVARYFALFGVRPHQTKNFKLPNGSLLVEKVRKIVGLYLISSSNALVLCADEKGLCQALQHNQPLLPMGLGYVEGIIHVRYSITTLFAAFNAATGQVTTQCKPRHRHQGFIAFLNHIDRAVPADLDVHLVFDNYTTRKHSKVKLWLANRTRYHIHSMLTYSSWFNQVEHWFGLVTQQAIRRAPLDRVCQRVSNIQRYVDQYKLHKRPFM